MTSRVGRKPEPDSLYAAVMALRRLGRRVYRDGRHSRIGNRKCSPYVVKRLADNLKASR